MQFSAASAKHKQVVSPQRVLHQDSYGIYCTERRADLSWFVRRGTAANAVAIQDQLPYTEPPFWYYPTRQSLGAALLAGGDAAGAEGVFREDLKMHPHNGWSMFGLAQSLDAQGKEQEAAGVREKFTMSWQFADVELKAAIL